MSKKIIQTTGLKCIREWTNYCNNIKKPQNIPASPYRVYKEQWKNWGHWLGTGNIAPQNMDFRAFDEAVKFVHTLKLKTWTEWQQIYCKSGEKPNDIPGNPYIVYKEQWQGTGYWLGTGSVHAWRNFNEALKFVHSLKLKYKKEWYAYCKSGKKPADIPSNPYVVYKKHWQSWMHWLGNQKFKKIMLDN